MLDDVVDDNVADVITAVDNVVNDNMAGDVSDQVSDANIRFNKLVGKSDTPLEQLQECIDDPEFNIYGTDKYGLMPIHRAALEEPTGALVRKLLEMGCDPNMITNYNGFTPAHYATTSHFIKNLRVLATNGADFTLQTVHGETPHDMVMTMLSLHIYTRERLEPFLEFFESINGSFTKSAMKK